jgi:hypothetical protein
MLMQFVVENFRSFRGKAVLSLVAAEGIEHAEHPIAQEEHEVVPRQLRRPSLRRGLPAGALRRDPVPRRSRQARLDPGRRGVGVASKLSRTGLVDRRVQHHDARIFVVATEGTETERHYFTGLQERDIVDRSRVHIEVIVTPRVDGISAPKHVLARLDTFASRYHLVDGLDELWLVIDVDRWPEQQLSEVAQQCVQKRYLMAVSRPCFELWLLLHVAVDVSAIETCADCEVALRRILGAYNKSRLDLAPYTRAAIESAIARARVLDADESDRWPRAIGSHVHRLADRLLRSTRY